MGDLNASELILKRTYKYLIDPNSVERRIKQLQQALHFSIRTSPDMSSYVETTSETQPDMSRHDEQARETEAHNEETEYLAKRVEELENENIHLKISKAANEQVINQLNAERKEFLSQVTDMSFRLGEAQAKLQLLDAPRPEARHVQTEPESQVSDAVEVPTPAPTPPQAPPAVEPMPVAQAAEQKPGFFKRLLGR
jgi:chromosome segregation ATPase